MFLSDVRKIYAAAFVLIAVVCLASGPLSAQEVTLPNIIYTAAGTFSYPAISGNDLYELAGNPFRINLVANEATRPHSTGKGYATYIDLKMKGSVQSGLLTSATTIEGSHFFLVLAIGIDHDTVEIKGPVVVLHQSIMIDAKFILPKGTLTKYTIWPFSGPATLSPSSGTVSYSNSGATTTLTVASGTISTQKGRPAAGTMAAALHVLPAVFDWAEPSAALVSKFMHWA